jgi:DNA-binding NtrC family response regulator
MNRQGKRAKRAVLKKAKSASQPRRYGRGAGILNPIDREVCLLEKDILIVDDDLGVREVLGGALQDAGYTVDFAATAAEATNLLRECRYGMAVVDWRLPDGDGAAIASLAAAAGSRAFVMSGYPPRMQPDSVDPRATLMRPVGPPELLAAARAYIGKAAGV